MSPNQAYADLRRVNYGGRDLWAATVPELDTTEGTGTTREAALDDLVRQLAERIATIRGGLALRALAREQGNVT